MRPTTQLVGVLALVTCVSADYEWAGIFSTPDASYTWIAQKVNGDYADPTMSTRAAGPKTLAAACVPASMWVYTAEGAR